MDFRYSTKLKCILLYILFLSTPPSACTQCPDEGFTAEILTTVRNKLTKIFSQLNVFYCSTGWTKKNVSLLQTKTLSTSYSKTTILLGVEIWQLGVLRSTPCCQISTPYRLVVSEYEVPKVFVCKSDTFFLVHPVV